MKEIRPDHVAIYVRWSTDDQSEGTTLAVQLEGCRHYALSQGWLPQESLTFIDDGYSGGNLNRPGLIRLRQLIAAGDVDCVVVFKVDRLSRNIVDAVELVLGEWLGRCYFKSAREPIDTSTDLGRVIFGILAMFADFERSQIRERTQSGKTRRIADGKQLHGQPCFGYAPAGSKGRWVEAPGEAAVVRRIFRLAAEGQSASSICRQLNGEGIHTRAGKLWSLRSLLWVLQNRIYIGEVVYGRTQVQPAQKRTASGKPARIPRPTPVVQTATQAAPPLVTVAEFEAAGRQLARHRTVRRTCGPRSLASPHLLVGLARCRCGGTLVAKRQGRSVSYVCHSARTGRCGLGPGLIPQPLADRVVLALFAALYLAEGTRRERLLAAVPDLLADCDTLRAEERGLVRSLAGLDEQEGRLLSAARSGELDLGDLRDLRSAIARERADQTERLHRLREQIASRQQQLAAVEAAVERLGAGAKLDCLSTTDQRRLLQLALAAPVTLFKAKGSRLLEVDLVWASAGPTP